MTSRSGRDSGSVRGFLDLERAGSSRITPPEKIDFAPSQSRDFPTTPSAVVAKVEHVLIVGWQMAPDGFVPGVLEEPLTWRALLQSFGERRTRRGGEDLAFRGQHEYAMEGSRLAVNRGSLGVLLDSDAADSRRCAWR
jgi:hypothetical protein